jgi:hypothetical protein
MQLRLAPLKNVMLEKIMTFFTLVRSSHHLPVFLVAFMVLTKILHRFCDQKFLALGGGFRWTSIGGSG